MPKNIYLTSIEKRAGKSFVSLGILSILKDQYPDLLCYKLFSEANDKDQISLLESLTQSSISSLMDINKAIMLMHDYPEDLFASILEATQVSKKSDLNYFEGTDFGSDNDVYEYQFNLTIAHQLNCDVVLVVSAEDRTLEHTLTVLHNALEISKKNHANVQGVVINRVPSEQEQEARSFFKKHFANLSFVTIVPEFEELTNPTVLDIATKLDAEIICGPEQLHRSAKQFTIAAKTVGGFLESSVDRSGMMIITPCDRVDILLGSLLADQSVHYPKIAGIVLTGGEKLGTVIQKIINGLENAFPVLLTKHKTYETATLLFSSKFSLSNQNPVRAQFAMQSIIPYLSEALLKIKDLKSPFSTINPTTFLYNLIQKAKQPKRHIVLPEGQDARILMAADYLLKRNICDITLLGNAEKIRLLAKRDELELPNVRIIDISQSEKKEAYAEQYFQLRKHKNINFPIALERMSDLNYFAAMMVYCNDADAMVSGADHTTADTVRPALEIIKTKPGVTKVSSIFIMCMPARVLIYGDCAINTEPDSQTLAEITEQAVDIANRLGIDPRVALLSYSSGKSGKGESVDKVAKAFELVHQKMPELLVEGPIQYDAAVDPGVAAKKLPQSQLAGNANVLIFPDLNTGNNTYKAVQRESGALAIGPVLLGLNKPVNDLSRGCTPQDIINTILVSAIQIEKRDL
jgi:phosphate acetyltransferase